MAAERAVLNITLCPKFNEARLRWVFKAASSYPRRWHNYEQLREFKIVKRHPVNYTFQGNLKRRKRGNIKGKVRI